MKEKNILVYKKKAPLKLILGHFLIFT